MTALSEYQARDRLNQALREQLLRSLDVVWNQSDKSITSATIRTGAMFFKVGRDYLRTSSTAPAADSFPTNPYLFTFAVDRTASAMELLPIGYLLRKPFKMSMLSLTRNLTDGVGINAIPYSYMMLPADSVANADARRFKVFGGETALIGNGGTNQYFGANQAVVDVCMVDSSTDHLQLWSDATPAGSTFNPDAYDNPPAYPEVGRRVQQSVGELIQSFHAAAPLAGAGVKLVVDDLAHPIALRQCGIVQVGVLPPVVNDSIGANHFIAATSPASSVLAFGGSTLESYATGVASVTVPIEVVCGMDSSDGNDSYCKWVSAAAAAILSNFSAVQLDLTRPAGDYAWLGVTMGGSLAPVPLDGRPDIVHCRVELNVIVPYLVGKGTLT